MSIKIAMLEAQNKDLMERAKQLTKELTREKAINTGLMTELLSANNHIDRLEAVGHDFSN